jgi:hypothetical protein
MSIQAGPGGAFTNCCSPTLQWITVTSTFVTINVGNSVVEHSDGAQTLLVKIFVTVLSAHLARTFLVVVRKTVSIVLIVL